MKTLRNFFELVRKTDKSLRKSTSTSCPDPSEHSESDDDDDEPLIKLRHIEDIVEVKIEKIEVEQPDSSQLSKNSKINNILNRLSKNVSISKISTPVMDHLEPKIEVHSMKFDESPTYNSEFENYTSELVSDNEDNFGSGDETEESDEDFVPSGKVNSKKVSPPGGQTTRKKTEPKKQTSRKSDSGDYDKQTVITITDPKYVCGICKFPFQSYEDLKEHISSGTCNELSLTCNVCQKVFDKRSKLSKHRSNHFKNAKSTCEKCGRMYSSKTNLENHQLQCMGRQDYEDDREGPIQFKCTDCDKTFGRRTELFEHIKNHPVSFYNNAGFFRKKIFSDFLHFTFTERTVV